MKKRISNLLLFAQLLLLVLFFFLFFLILKDSPNKVGVIRSAYLVENYAGMKEAHAVLNDRVKGWHNSLDTLQSDLQVALSQHNLTLEDLKASNEHLLPTQVVVAKGNYEKYYQLISEKKSSEEEKLIQGALNQINSEIQAYAKANDFHIIIGQLTDGNILYAEEALDITEQILNIVNQKYHGATQ